MSRKPGSSAPPPWAEKSILRKTPISTKEDKGNEPVPPYVRKQSTDSSQHPILKKQSTVEAKPPPTESKPCLEKPSSKKPPKGPSAAPGAPAPPPPPPAPAPPPPPPGFVGETTAKSPAQLAKIEALRKGARRRPDYGTLMKEIEQGKKLNHVKCNDRSKPIIPRLKSFAGKFVFDSEAKPATKKDAIHNCLLSEIQQGVKLKKVVTNDRSRPILAGLRKFRRQTTMEGEEAKEENEDEMVMKALDMELIDDIDALRDDLQSTKQMVELEIQAKNAIEKENRDLRCQIIAMEAENTNLKTQLGIVPEDLTLLDRRDSAGLKDVRRSRSGLYKSASGIKSSKSMKFSPVDENIGEMNELEEEMNGLKQQVQLLRKCADEWEIKCEELNQAMAVSKGKLEDSEQKRLTLEKKLELVVARKGIAAVTTVDRMTQTAEQPPDRRVSRQMSQGSDPLGGEEEESEEEESDVDEESILKKKQQSELKLWENKYKNIRERRGACKKERLNLKNQQRELENELKKSKQGYKELQKEVSKMATMLKDNQGDEESEDEDESEENEEEEGSEEESSEEEEEEDEEEDELSSEEEPLPEGQSHEAAMATLNVRVKREENKIGALKKGNFLLKANIDHLKDNLDEVKIKYEELNHELNTILSDV